MAAAVTQFSPPGACSTAWWGSRTQDTQWGIRVGVQCYSGTLYDDSSCSPETPTACPSMWTSFRTDFSDYTTCCPPGYTTRTSLCASYAGGFELAAYQCSEGLNPTQITGTFTFTPVIWAAPIFVEPTGTESSSSPSSSTTASHSSSSTLASSTTGTISSATLLPTPTNSQRPDKSLSAGRIAGIVIGSVGALALVVLVAVVLLRRRKHSSASTTLELPTSPYVPNPEIDTANTYSSSAAAHLSHASMSPAPRYQTDYPEFVGNDATHYSYRPTI